nr:Chain B, STEROID RECEPTOR COACTIVATOR-1 [synthetic construct]
HKILHRLLQE